MKMNISNNWYWAFFKIVFKALVLSISGQETLIMSAPASLQASIWSIVALMSVVKVFVIVCTVIGESSYWYGSNHNFSTTTSIYASPGSY